MSSWCSSIHAASASSAFKQSLGRAGETRWLPDGNAELGLSDHCPVVADVAQGAPTPGLAHFLGRARRIALA